MRFQSESTGSSGYTGYVIIYIPSHSDTCDIVDSNVVSNSIVVLVEEVYNTLAEPHTLDAVEHTLAVVVHSKDLLLRNLIVQRLLLQQLE